MKTSFLFCALLLAGAAPVWAQGPSPSVSRPSGGAESSRKKKSSEDTRTKALEAATSLYKAVPDDVKSKAKDLLSSPEAAAARQKALEAAQRAVQGNSGAAAAAASMIGGTTPAGASAAGSQPPATPATPAAAPSPSTPVAEAPPPAPSGPKPKPLQPLNLDEAPRATSNMIRISAKKDAFFDVNKGYGIYTGDVRARHPQIYIECEELEIFMTKQAGGALGGGGKPRNAQDADILADKKKGNDAPPIEKAEARGPMVTVEKMSEQGDLQVGHCKHLIYDGKTGNTTLMEWPQVQVGNKLHKATEPGCVMIIDQKGMLTTHGGHETIILQGEDAAPRSRAGTATAP